MAGWALVTGASKRIGREIALELAAHGWDIVVHYHHSETEALELAKNIQDLGRSACLAEIDLADAMMTGKLIPSLAAEIGVIGALVNNAALFEPDELDHDGARHKAVNVDAPRLLSKAFRDHLFKGERAVIINLLDATARSEKFTAYGKSKDFLEKMTINMAKSFAPQVRVNGVAPMYVLPSPRQSTAAFRKMAEGKIVTTQQVALAVRKMIETDITGKIITVSAP